MPADKIRFARFALMALFFNAGLIYASWGVQIPFVKARFELNAAALAAALFALSVGSIMALTQLGNLLARVSGRRACTASGIALATALALVLWMPNYGLLCGGLLLFGAINASLDVAVNTEAATLEAACGRPIMSSLHAMFSVGGVAGAGVGAMLLGRGVSAQQHLLLVAVLAIGITLVARPALSTTAGGHQVPSNDDTPQGNADHAVRHEDDMPTLSDTGLSSSGTATAQRRSGYLWALGGVALIALVAEGAMYDWSTVYMRDVLQAGPAASSAAYGTFSTGMAMGRFSGDWIRARVDDATLVLCSGMLAAFGMGIVLIGHRPIMALGGFFMMGLGLANMIPLLFAAAGRVPGVAPSRGIARVAGMAYAGMMAGPVLIGLVTQMTNLSGGLMTVAIASAAVGIVGARVLSAPSARP